MSTESVQSWKIYLFIVIVLIIAYIAVFVWWKSRNGGWREKFSLWKKDDSDKSDESECSSVSSSENEDDHLHITIEHTHAHDHPAPKPLPPPPVPKPAPKPAPKPVPMPAPKPAPMPAPMPEPKHVHKHVHKPAPKPVPNHDHDHDHEYEHEHEHEHEHESSRRRHHHSSSSDSSDSSDSDDDDDMYDENVHKNLTEYDARMCTMNAFRRIFNRNATPEEISKYSQLKCTSDIDKAVSNMKIEGVTKSSNKKKTPIKIDEDDSGSDDDKKGIDRVRNTFRPKTETNISTRPLESKKNNNANRRRQGQRSDAVTENGNGKCLNSWYSGAPYTSSASPYTPYDRMPKNIEDDPTASRLLKGLRTIDNNQCMTSQHAAARKRQQQQNQQNSNSLDGFDGLDMFDDFNNVTNVNCSKPSPYTDSYRDNLQKSTKGRNGKKMTSLSGSGSGSISSMGSGKKVAIDSDQMLAYLDNICKQVDSAKDLVSINRSI